MFSHPFEKTKSIKKNWDKSESEGVSLDEDPPKHFYVSFFNFIFMGSEYYPSWEYESVCVVWYRRK